MKVASQLRTGAPGGGNSGFANPSVWLKARAVHLHPRDRKTCGCFEKSRKMTRVNLDTHPIADGETANEADEAS